MPRVIPRRNIPHDFVQFVNEYLLNRSLRERSTLEENYHKGVLMDVLEQVGVPQEGGHRTITLDDPIVFHHYPSRGNTLDKKVIGIERKRRHSMNLNEERVMEYLQRKGLV